VAKKRHRSVARRAPVAAPPPTGLSEPPHGHIVCRRCGRIRPLDLTPADTRLLVELSDRGPPNWSVERIAYSLAAVCPTCAATPPA